MTADLETEIRTFFENKKEVAAIYLFGSQASGNDSPKSDIDVGILLRREYLDSAESLKETSIVKLGRALKKDIHPVIMNGAGEVLLKQIFSKGKAILVRDEKFHKNFKMIAFSDIADFNYYLQKMQAGFTRRILEE